MAIGKVTATVSCCVLFATYAAAAPLGPAKPSQVVLLRQNFLDFIECGASGAAPFDRQIMPDGSDVAFQIPAGQVLVATEMTVYIAGFSSISSFVLLELGFEQGSGPLNAVAYAGFPTDASGNAFGAQQFSPGVIFKSGKSVCALPDGANVHLTLLGYLTKDK